MTDTSVLVNGLSAGPTHQGGFYRFQYDITPLVKVGQTNQLVVNVDAESANVSVNRAERTADYWNFSGIYRPVYLEAFPLQSIERVAVNAQADGAFALDVYSVGLTTADSVEARGVPRAQVALAWLLQKPGITAPIVGASKPHHLEDAVAALSLALTPDEVARLEEPYIPHPVAGFS